MTLDEAIEVLEQVELGSMPRYNPNATRAFKMAKEALEFKQNLRQHTVDDFDALLPGETEAH